MVSRTLFGVALVLGWLAGGSPAFGQDTSFAAEPTRQAETVAGQWLRQVWGGEAGEAWQAASLRFQKRIGAAEWGTWVRAQNGRLAARSERRVVGVDFTGDPISAAQWVTVTYASDLQVGGQLLQRIWLVQEEDEPWRVAHYALWKDAAAMMTTAYFDPIPYVYWASDDGYPGYWFFRQIPARLIPKRRAATPPPPPPPQAIANPKTFPRRQPTG